MSKKEERIREENTNNQGLKMWIKEYRRSDDIDVEFEDGYISRHKAYCSFKKKEIFNPNFKNSNIKSRVGEIGYNNQGLKMEIVKYNKNTDIDVKFENGYVAQNVRYVHFCDGKIKNPYFATVCNMGYIGKGEYSIYKNKKLTNEYKIWCSMLTRCYDKKFHYREKSYKNCTVCEEWHNFQNFAEWYYNNYYEISNEKMELDKDILIKGNKMYSPNTCIFVPKKINTLFVNKKNGRGRFLIGVYYNKKNNKFVSQCYMYNNVVYLGRFETEIEAFDAYKKFKEKYIKQVADEYKDKIPKKLYEAMYSYKVEITD